MYSYNYYDIIVRSIYKYYSYVPPPSDASDPCDPPTKLSALRRELRADERLSSGSYLDHMTIT